MTEEMLWLLKLFIAHMLADFVFQPYSWVTHRNQYHFASSRLYFHVLIVTGLSLLFVGPDYWVAVVFIGLTHFLIDGWKSYRKQSAAIFLIDQGLHLLMIGLAWLFAFDLWQDIIPWINNLKVETEFWKIFAAVLFLTTPAGILIGMLTQKWRNKIENNESLAHAGKWIGISERLIILVFVVLHQYAAISILVAAKGIIRFNEKDRLEIKTEYLVVGTLLSMGIAIATGLAIMF